MPQQGIYMPQPAVGWLSVDTPVEHLRVTGNQPLLLAGGEMFICRAIDKGLRTAALIRLVGQEDGLLSHTHDGPRMYINLEDYIFWNSNQTVNQPFRKIIGLLTGDPACTAQ